MNQTDLAGRQSHCSPTPITYVESTPRAAAIKKCKKKHKGKAQKKKRKKCIKKADRYPV